MNGRDGTLNTISSQHADPLAFVLSNLGIQTNDGSVRSYHTDLNRNVSSAGLDDYDDNCDTPKTSKRRTTLMDQVLKKPLRFASKQLSNLTMSNGPRTSPFPKPNVPTNMLDTSRDTIASHRVACEQPQAPEEPPSPSGHSHSSSSRRRQRKTRNVSLSSSTCSSSRRSDGKSQNRSSRRRGSNREGGRSNEGASPKQPGSPRNRGRSTSVAASKCSVCSRPQPTGGRSASVAALQRTLKKQPLRPSNDGGHGASIAFPRTQPRLPSSLECGSAGTPLKIAQYQQQQQEQHQPRPEAHWECSACHCMENETRLKFCVGCATPNQAKSALAD